MFLMFILKYVCFSNLEEPTDPVGPCDPHKKCSGCTCGEIGIFSDGVCGTSTGGNLPGCSGELDLDGAKAFCAIGGLRLCTAVELLDNIVSGIHCIQVTGMTKFVFLMPIMWVSWEHSTNNRVIMFCTLHIACTSWMSCVMHHTCARSHTTHYTHNTQRATQRATQTHRHTDIRRHTNTLHVHSTHHMHHTTPTHHHIKSTQTHTHKHTHKHSHTQTQPHTDTHRHTHSHNTPTPTHTQTYIDTQIQTHRDTH